MYLKVKNVRVWDRGSTRHLCTLGMEHVAIQSKCHVCHLVPVNPLLIEIIIGKQTRSWNLRGPIM